MTAQQIQVAIWRAASTRIGHAAVSAVMWADSGAHRDYIANECRLLASACSKRQLDAVSIESAIIVVMHRN